MHQKLTILSSFLGLSIIVISCGARAEVDYSKNFVDVDFFSLSKQKEDAFDAPAAVFIISAEDIRRSGATTIPDVLRLAPGIQVAQQNSHTWTVTSRGFGNQFANKLLVMVDGRAIYKPLFSGTFWDTEDMSLGNIDRIEVIRGPGGTIWGSNAVNGIIHIITKKPMETLGSSLSTVLGGDGDKIVDVSHGAALDSGDSYRVFAHNASRSHEYLKSGNRSDDGWKSTNAGFRYDTNHLKKDELSIQGALQDSTSESFFSLVPTLTAPFVKPYPLSKYQRNAHLLTKWDHEVDEDFRTIAQVYFDYDNLESGIVNWTGYTFDVDLQQEYLANEVHQLTTGLGMRHLINQQENTDSYVVYRNTQRQDTVFNLFLQDKIRLSSDKSYLTLGSKLEHNDYTGFEYEPSARLTYYPDDNQTLWVAITRSVRTPSIGERDAIVKLVGTPRGFVGRNYMEGYTSENLLAYEAGYRTVPYDQLLIEATLFYNDYDSLRTLEPMSPLPGFIVSNGTKNGGYGTSYGAEINTKFQVSRDLRIQTAYSLMQMDLFLNSGARDATFFVQEEQFPSQQFSLNSFYNIRPDIEFDNSLYFVDQIVAFNTSQPIHSYTRLDSRISWDALDNLELSLNGHNLLDDRHQEFQPSLYSLPEEIGRSFFAKLAVKF